MCIVQATGYFLRLKFVSKADASMVKLLKFIQTYFRRVEVGASVKLYILIYYTIIFLSKKKVYDIEPVRKNIFRSLYSLGSLT
jgi:hypothetical protein